MHFADPTLVSCNGFAMSVKKSQPHFALTLGVLYAKLRTELMQWPCHDQCFH